MANLQRWMSRETWQTICLTWQIFPVAVTMQRLFRANPSAPTRLTPPSTLEAYIVSALMSLPSALIILYSTITSHSRPLPVGNWTMVVLHTVYSTYCAFLSPAPSILKLSLNVGLVARDEIAAAVMAQVLCGLALGGWLSGYGKSSEQDWSGMVYVVEVGLVIWGWAFLATILHEDELRPWAQHDGQPVSNGAEPEKEKEQDQKEQERPKLPRSYLFKYMLYPHYMFSFIMWTGFWMIGGWDCEPARVVLVYEFSTTVVKALRGRKECMRVFDAKEVERRWVIAPGIF